MKKNIYKYFIILSAIMFTAYSCDDAKFSPIQNGIYIQEAAPSDRYNQQVENLTIEGETVQNITIRLAKYIDKDVSVNVEIDYDFLNEYNKTHGTSYEVLPEEYLDFDHTAVIAAGEVFAPVTNINIKPFLTPNGEAYAIPIKVSSADGSINVVGNAGRIIYLLSAPHMQKSPIFNGQNRRSKVIFDSPIKTPKWTVEYWFRMNSSWSSSNSVVFADNAAPISFNTGTDSELFIRFWSTGALKLGPCYQCQMVGTYFDDSTEAWKADTWYHIAYVYDGEKVQLYIDGEPNANKDVDKDFEFSNMELCINFASSTITQFAQIRIWNRELQQSNIKDAMSRQVSNDAQGLIGYWKCDEGEGTVLKDSSPNGNDLQINGSFNWSDEYNFSKPNK